MYVFENEQFDLALKMTQNILSKPRHHRLEMFGHFNVGLILFESQDLSYSSVQWAQGFSIGSPFWTNIPENRITVQYQRLIQPPYADMYRMFKYILNKLQQEAEDIKVITLLGNG